MHKSRTKMVHQSREAVPIVMVRKVIESFPKRPKNWVWKEESQLTGHIFKI